MFIVVYKLWENDINCLDSVKSLINKDTTIPVKMVIFTRFYMCTAHCPVSNFTVFWFIDRKVLLCRSKNLIPLGIRRWWNQYEITIYVLKCTTYSNYFGFPKLHNLVAHLLIPNNTDVILCLYILDTVIPTHPSEIQIIPPLPPPSTLLTYDPKQLCCVNPFHPLLL